MQQHIWKQSTPPCPPFFPVGKAENDRQVRKDQPCWMSLHQFSDGRIMEFVFKSPAQCLMQRNFMVKLGCTEFNIQTFRFLNEIKEDINFWKWYTFGSSYQFKVWLSEVGWRWGSRENCWKFLIQSPRLEQYVLNFIKKRIIACEHSANESGWFFYVGNSPRNESDAIMIAFT